MNIKTLELLHKYCYKKPMINLKPQTASEMHLGVGVGKEIPSFLILFSKIKCNRKSFFFSMNICLLKKNFFLHPPFKSLLDTTCT